MLGIVSHSDCLRHDAGPLHPDTRDRLDAISNQLISSGLDFVVRHYDAPCVTRAQLERVHDPAYLDRIHTLASGAQQVCAADDFHLRRFRCPLTR